MATPKNQSTRKKEALAKAQLNETLADELSIICHFSAEEIKALLHTYDCLVKTAKLERLSFRRFFYSCFELTHDLMLDLIFRVFDRNEDGVVEASEFVQGLSVMIRGDTDEITEFCYNVYDMNGDNTLGREELELCLKGCLMPGYGLEVEEIEDAERDLVDIAMKKLDVNRDGVITFEDFQTAVRRDPLLVQACGPCLISPKCMSRFLYTVTWDYRTYTSELLNNTVTSRKSKEMKGSGPRQSSTNLSTIFDIFH